MKHTNDNLKMYALLSSQSSLKKTLQPSSKKRKRYEEEDSYNDDTNSAPQQFDDDDDDNDYVVFNYQDESSPLSAVTKRMKHEDIEFWKYCEHCEEEVESLDNLLECTKCCKFVCQDCLSLRSRHGGSIVCADCKSPNCDKCGVALKPDNVNYYEDPEREKWKLTCGNCRYDTCYNCDKYLFDEFNEDYWSCSSCSSYTVCSSDCRVVCDYCHECVTCEICHLENCHICNSEYCILAKDVTSICNVCSRVVCKNCTKKCDMCLQMNCGSCIICVCVLTFSLLKHRQFFIDLELICIR
jgi:hypothetical protein